MRKFVDVHVLGGMYLNRLKIKCLLHYCKQVLATCSFSVKCRTAGAPAIVIPPSLGHLLQLCAHAIHVTHDVTPPSRVFGDSLLKRFVVCVIGAESLARRRHLVQTALRPRHHAAVVKHRLQNVRAPFMSKSWVALVYDEY